MLKALKELCQINGTSGNEENVREYIINQIKNYAEYSVDNIGNILAFKKGKETPNKKVMVAAHMDEVGFIVSYIKSDGTLSFSSVGGIDPLVVLGRRVYVGAKKLSGVIGSKAYHNMSADERDKIPSMSSMYIDIGASSKEEAEKYVSLGDMVTFQSEFVQFGENKLKAKALDDRAGCAMMINMIKSDLPYDLHFAFTTQEEIGLRGAKVATYTINPDIAIILECTAISDIASVSGEKRVCEQGNGAVVSYMDRATIYNKELYNLAFEVAKENNIKCQTKTMVSGGNDSGAIHVSRGGVKTVALSIPTRYIHSASCVASIDDINAVNDLANALIPRICKL